MVLAYHAYPGFTSAIQKSITVHSEDSEEEGPRRGVRGDRNDLGWQLVTINTERSVCLLISPQLGCFQHLDLSPPPAVTRVNTLKGRRKLWR
jgi:hypothetical protein